MKLLIIAGILISLTSCFSGTDSKITVANHASEPIATMQVSIAGQSMAFDNMEPNAIRTASYKVKADDHFKISGIFKSGKAFQKEEGYVTNGMNFEHQIIVEDSGISVTQASVK